MNHLRLSIALSLALLVLLCAGTASTFQLSAQSSAVGSKFDPWLRQAMGGGASLQRSARSIGLRSNATPRALVRALVKVEGGTSELEAYLKSVGGAITSRHGNVVVVRLPFDELAGLEGLGSVARVEASRPTKQRLDIARQADGINLAALQAANPELTGKGVLIGIIDSAVDTSLAAFKDADGHSRILYYWDQFGTDTARQPTVLNPDGTTRSFTYGSEYTSADIDSGTFSSDGATGHGTHVAGIAAGRDAAYPGVAPEADLMVVSYRLDNDLLLGADTGAMLDAYDYLLARARDLGRPLVVNNSNGAELGPHDGSTLFEQAIQNDIDQQGLITTVSAGNSADDNLHKRVTINPGDTQLIEVIFYHTLDNYPLNDAVDMWMPNATDVDLTIARFFGGPESLGGSLVAVASLSDGQVADQTPLDLSNLDGDFFAFVFKDDSLGSEEFLISFLARDYQDPNAFEAEAYYSLYFTNNGATAIELDLYQEDPGLSFVLDADPFGTVLMPATTPGAISVGAYNTRNSYGTVTDGSVTVGALSSFSSLGPPRTSTRFTGVNARKPDLIAPGQFVISQLAGGATPSNPSDVVDGHLVSQGTSQSAPMVAGIVALLLQEDPDATAAEIKQYLIGSARADGFTGVVPNDNAGNGKVDVVAAVADVVSPTPVLASVVLIGESQLHLLGSNFAASCQVLVDGTVIDGSLVEYQDENNLLVTLPEQFRARRDVQTVVVRNPRAPDNSETSSGVTFAPTSDSAPQPGSTDTASTSVGGASGFSGGGGGCFIATAAYGSYLDPGVVALRGFRDRWLLTNAAGRLFVAAYYRLSPPVAAFIADRPALRTGVRLMLTPVVFAVTSPVDALACGLLLACLGAVMVRARRRRLAAAA